MIQRRCTRLSLESMSEWVSEWARGVVSGKGKWDSGSRSLKRITSKVQAEGEGFYTERVARPSEWNQSSSKGPVQKCKAREHGEESDVIRTAKLSKEMNMVVTCEVLIWLEICNTIMLTISYS